MVHRALQLPEKPLSSSVRSGHSIPGLLMYGNEISAMLRNFSITAVLFARLCTLRMLLRVSIPVSERSPKKGAFPNENALLKLLYLRITELYKKWNGSKVQNWAMVQNQLATNDKMKARIEKYEHLI